MWPKVKLCLCLEVNPKQQTLPPNSLQLFRPHFEPTILNLLLLHYFMNHISALKYLIFACLSLYLYLYRTLIYTHINIRMSNSFCLLSSTLSQWGIGVMGFAALLLR